MVDFPSIPGGSVRRPAVVPGSRQDYVQQAVIAAQQVGIPANGFTAQIQKESGFNPHAVSPAGARGIAQFMPATARGLGINPDDPRQALPAAARLMASYGQKYKRWDLALAAYNGGPGVADRLRIDPGYNRALRDGQQPAQAVAQATTIPAETRGYIAALAPTYGAFRIGGGAVSPQDIPGQITGAIGEALDVPGRIIEFVKSLGLRIVYVVGGGVLMILGMVGIYRSLR